MTTLREAVQEFVADYDCGGCGHFAAYAERFRKLLAQETQTPCDIAEDGVCEVLDCCRNRSQILEALEIGYDSAQAEAAQYHAAMAGYRPERHVEMDANVAKIAAAITAVKAALAQQEPEPVAPYAWMAVGGTIWRRKTSEDDVPLYTHPPRREWRSLSEEEIRRMGIETPGQQGGWNLAFARAIETKLKEKNA